MWRLFALMMIPLAMGVFAGAPLAQSSLSKPVLVAQAEKPKTLFDLLFGPRETSPPPTRNQPTRSAPSRPSSSPSITTLAPAKPAVDKSENATRIAVFGDSLAIDLSKALERHFADDPNVVVVDKGQGSSGFVRDDFFDWDGALKAEIAANSFDIAVVIIGINDRQPLSKGGRELKPLSDEWKALYAARVDEFLGQLRAAGKPVVWAGLPPMRAKTYSAAIAQISSLQKRAVFAQGFEFVDIYDRFTDEAGAFSSYGPDVNGQTQQLRKSDGIHFTRVGADKLAFYVSQGLKTVYSGGVVGIEVSDVLAGTDAAGMIRPPLQGIEGARRLEIAGPVQALGGKPVRAQALVGSTAVIDGPGFDIKQMLMAPPGRADAFGAGVSPGGDQGSRMPQ